MNAVVWLFVFAYGVSVSASQPAAPKVLKVDPPSWWARHTLNPVRLLVYGENLTGARVRPTTSALTASSVLVNDRGTYLFINVTVNRRAQPGSHNLVLETKAGKATIPFRIERQLDPSTNFQGVTTNDVIYLIMTDRFANGDTTNDAPIDSPPAANDRSNPRAYHGGDLRGVINHLPYLKDLGVTAIWLTPWYNNWNGINTCDKPWCPNTYYHGYHAIDYYKVEDRFGDLETLQELVRKAHAMGVKIVQDQVANHVGSHHPWVSDSPLPQWFHGTLARHELNKFQNSVLLSPNANSREVRNTLDGWFNDDLPDVNQDEPEVSRYEIQNSLWWIGVTGIDGIRQDTIQYMPRTFIRDWSNALHRQYPKMWLVGEVFERDAAQTAFFIGGHRGWDGIDTKLDSVFDFSLWDVSLQVFTGKTPVRKLRDQLKYDALYPNPFKITTLANNHDTVRFLSLNGATLEGAMMHTAFILSVRGTPQLYYGEEIAMEGKEDPDNRRDFPGGFPGDRINAFRIGGRTTQQQRMYAWTRDWIRLRSEHPALRSGRLIDLFYDDDGYAFARKSNAETVVVAFNRSKQIKEFAIPAADLGAAQSLVPLINGDAQVPVVSGRVLLKLRPMTAAAFEVR